MCDNYVSNLLFLEGLERLIATDTNEQSVCLIVFLNNP